MKKRDFPVVPKEPTPFKMMCDELEVGYMDIAKAVKLYRELKQLGSRSNNQLKPKNYESNY